MSLDVCLYEDLNDEESVYSSNITHNCNVMAMEANIYEALWHPERIRCFKAKDIIGIVTEGFVDMLKNPEYYKKFEPSNGWGTYEHFIDWVYDYTKALVKYPECYLITDT